MMERRIYSVSQVNRYIQGLFAEDFLLEGLWLQGELSNFKHHTSGHMYFTLKDRDSAIGGMMFKINAQMLPFRPQDGMSVIVWGAVSVYERTGQYRIIAELMEPVGIGALALAFEQMKQKLAAEGLFDADYKRELPENPKEIAVITSPTGAAVRDIITVARRRNPAVKITVIPVLVQGDGAVPAILAGLEMANEKGTADAIILGRGGGSMEDLWAFNSEAVARAVFASEIPVISAVGHETDFTIADFVADLRAPTPSAAAELAVPDAAAKAEDMAYLALRLARAMDGRLEEERRRLAGLKPRLIRSIPHRMDAAGKRFAYLVDRLEGVSPLAVLKRGYVLVYDGGGRLVTHRAQAAAGDELSIRLQDGILYTRVIDRGEEEKDL